MMTTSNGDIFRVAGSLCGQLTGHLWIPHTKASDAELWYFLDLRLNKRLSKQSRGHYDVSVMYFTETYNIPFHPCLRPYADVITLLQPVHLRQYLIIRLWSVKSISSRPYDMRSKMYSQQYAIISTFKYQKETDIVSELHITVTS